MNTRQRIAPFLEAEQVDVVLDGRRIVTDISAALHTGEVVGLLGANGAGKSTIMKALAGLLPVAAGRVSLQGCDLKDWQATARARELAYMPQSRVCPWPLHVQELVALGRLPSQAMLSGLSAVDHAAIEEAMQRCEVTQFRQRSVTTLSGGEFARVLLARTLAVGADTLLLDEPAAGLDPAHQLAVMELLREQAQRGCAVLVILHDLSLASRHCDRLWLLDQGRLTATGAPAEVLSDANLARVFSVAVERTPHAGLVPLRRL